MRVPRLGKKVPRLGKRFRSILRKLKHDEETENDEVLTSKNR